MMISDNQMLQFFLGRPAAAILLAATVITLRLPFARKALECNRSRA